MAGDDNSFFGRSAMSVLRVDAQSFSPSAGVGSSESSQYYPQFAGGAQQGQVHSHFHADVTDSMIQRQYAPGEPAATGTGPAGEQTWFHGQQTWSATPPNASVNVMPNSGGVCGGPVSGVNRGEFFVSPNPVNSGTVPRDVGGYHGGGGGLGLLPVQGPTLLFPNTSNLSALNPFAAQQGAFNSAERANANFEDGRLLPNLSRSLFTDSPINPVSNSLGWFQEAVPASSDRRPLADSADPNSITISKAEYMALLGRGHDLAEATKAIEALRDNVRFLEHQLRARSDETRNIFTKAKEEAERELEPQVKEVCTALVKRATDAEEEKARIVALAQRNMSDATNAHFVNIKKIQELEESNSLCVEKIHEIEQQRLISEQGQAAASRALLTAKAQFHAELVRKEQEIERYRKSWSSGVPPQNRTPEVHDMAAGEARPQPAEDVFKSPVNSGSQKTRFEGEGRSDHVEAPAQPTAQGPVRQFLSRVMQEATASPLAMAAPAFMGGPDNLLNMQGPRQFMPVPMPMFRQAEGRSGQAQASTGGQGGAAGQQSAQPAFQFDPAGPSVQNGYLGRPSGRPPNDPPDGGANNAFNREDDEYRRPSQGGAAPGGGGGGGPAPVQVGSVFEVNREMNNLSSSKTPKINDIKIESLPTPGDIERWWIHLLTVLENAYPEDPEGVQRHYRQLRDLLDINAVDLLHEGKYKYLESKLNQILRTLISKHGDDDLKGKVEKETEDCYTEGHVRNRVRAEHMLVMINKHTTSMDSSVGVWDLQTLWNVRPKTRGDAERIHWLELENWVRRWENTLRRLKLRPDEATLYTIFVQESHVSKMKCLEWDWQLHDRLPEAEKTYDDMKSRIQAHIAKQRKEMNDRARKRGVSDSTHVPGVPALEALDEDGLLIVHGDPKADPAAPAPPQRGRSRSTQRKDNFSRNRSWRSDGGTVHSPSGYKYSRNKSRITPRGTRHPPRKFSRGGRAFYSKSPLNRTQTNRRSSNVTSRSVSQGGRPFRRSREGREGRRPSRERTAMPVVNNQFIAPGYCRYFAKGEVCPFMKEKNKCNYKHEHPPPASPRSAAPAEATAGQEGRGSNEASPPQRGSANSPRPAGADEF
jgi:hypothetical protein